MKKYSQAIIKTEKSMTLFENITGYSMILSMIFAITGMFLYIVNDCFFVNQTVDYMALSLMIAFFVSLLSTTVASVTRDFFKLHLNKCIDRYEKARKELFRHNMSIANEFYAEHRQVG